MCYTVKESNKNKTAQLDRNIMQSFIPKPVEVNFFKISFSHILLWNPKIILELLQKS